jgi:hypothetical protein
VIFSHLELIGLWAIDPSDEAARACFGDVEMELHANGSMTYTINEVGKKQVILLRYHVEDSELVTTQPSAPREERTRFTLASDGRLVLEYRGVHAHYVRRAGPTPS